MTGPDENSGFYFPRISMFHCSSTDQSLSDLLYSKTKQNQILKNALIFQRQHQGTCDHGQQRSRVTVNCFPFDLIVFAMLPAHNIWRETVSLLDVMLVSLLDGRAVAGKTLAI